MTLSRRAFAKTVALAAAASGAAALARPFLSAVAAAPQSSPDEYFLFIFAAGGWDVTLWSDPRIEKRGIIDPPTNVNTDVSGIKRWKDAPFDGGTTTFQPLTPAGAPFTFGPAIGDLLDLADRLTLVNGLAMNTVSHVDGSLLSATGRLPSAGRAVASSIDTVIAAELGADRLLPVLSAGFPSYHLGGLDRRAVPLRVGSIDAVTRLLSRADIHETEADRRRVTAVLSQEAADLAARADSPDIPSGLAAQYTALEKMVGGSLESVFSVPALQRAHPDFHYGARFAGPAAVSAAFAVEAMRKNLVRCVSFACGGFDTHTNNYRSQALALQDLFDLLAALIRALDRAPHPTRPGDRLSDHTHLLVLSEFCRTPQLNQAGGRDHYPNNSALIVSPRFRRSFVLGKTDPDQLLPLPVEGFPDGPRPLSPPDLLATYLHAFGLDPRRHLRDGEVLKALLAI